MNAIIRLNVESILKLALDITNRHVLALRVFHLFAIHLSLRCERQNDSQITLRYSSSSWSASNITLILNNKILSENFIHIKNIDQFSDSAIEILNLLEFIENPCCVWAREKICSLEYLWNWSFRLSHYENTRFWSCVDYTIPNNDVRVENCRCGQKLPDPSVSQYEIYSNEARFKILANI